MRKNKIGKLIVYEKSERYKKVGNLLFTTPISMPVRSPYDHVFNYYLRESQESGAYNHVLKTYERECHGPLCCAKYKMSASFLMCITLQRKLRKAHALCLKTPVSASFLMPVYVKNLFLKCILLKMRLHAFAENSRDSRDGLKNLF
jgi:hypothetical protein